MHHKSTAEPHPLCQLKLNRALNVSHCTSSAPCSKCGWNVYEADRRRIRFRQRGLTLCPDGLYRFLDFTEMPVE